MTADASTRTPIDGLRVVKGSPLTQDELAALIVALLSLSHRTDISLPTSRRDAEAIGPGPYLCDRGTAGRAWGKTQWHGALAHP